MAKQRANTYRVWIQIERSADEADAVALGPPEQIFEATSRRDVIAFLKGLPGDPPKATLSQLRRRTP